MTTTTSRSPRVLSAAGAATALLLGGCAVFSPVQTDRPYQPAEGISVDLGPVAVRNLALVSAGKGADAVLSGQVVNNGGDKVTLTIATESGAKAQVEVPAGGSVTISTPDKRTTLAKLAAAPGDLATVVLATPASGQSPTSVPVLAPEGSYEVFKG